MENDYSFRKLNWLKYIVICLLICPLSISAIDVHSVVDEQLSKAIEETGVRKELKPIVGVFQQGKRNLTGVVIDGIDNEPIIGANVIIQGTTTGVVTDFGGRFNIEIPERGVTLEISYIGYKKQTVHVTDQGIVTVKMTSDNEILDEIVVVGAGTQRKISVTGAISTISGASLSAPSSSLTSNFAGKLAGVIAKTNTGEPGVSSEFYIRGIGTFGGRATPLILLDGVEISSGDLNRIPAESIESFSILKDASATAIYGARGANGVMLVTTKSGNENTATKINVTIENSIVQPMRKMKYADGATWMDTYNIAAEARTPGITPKYTAEDIEMTRSHAAPYRYPDVDWQDLMFKNYTMNQRANVNISGGGAKITYYMSLQYNHDTGMLDTPKLYSLDNNINRSEYNFQNNLSYKLTSTTKLSLRMNAQIGNLKGPHITNMDDLFWAAYHTNPIVFPAYYPAQKDDRHIRFGNANLSGDRLYLNPYALMTNTFKQDNFNTLNISLNLDQDLKFITKGLSFKGLANIKSYNNVGFTRSMEPYYYRIADGSWNASDPDQFELERVGTSGNDFIQTSGASLANDQTFYFDARLDYDRNFGDHYVTGMLMYMQREFRSGVLPNRNQGVSGRVTYDYGHKYLAEFNFGYNGTERLQKGDRFEFFPAMSLGWVISNEGFWSPLEDQIGYLKLRGSYGIVGSDDTGKGWPTYAPHFLYTDNIGLGQGGYKTGATGQVTMSGPGFHAYAVQNARWERVNKLDVGFEAELFRQLNVSFSYFYDHRYHILLRRGAWPRMMGYANATPFSNIGEVDNKGIDLSVSWKKEIAKDLHMDIRGNLTYNKNKFVAVDDPAYPYVWQTRTGKPLSTTEGFIAEGYFQSQEEIDNSPTQSLGSPVMPGDLKYRDVNGDGIINDEDKVMTSPYGKEPRLQYGLGLNLTYKKLDFGVFFNGSAKRTIMINGLAPFRSGLDNGDRNLMQFIADDYWTPENPNAWYPRLGIASDQVENNMHASTHWQRNGNFVRFKTFEVGYSFPHCRIYFTGDNLAVWSPFKLWDPELDWHKYPLQRTFNIGLQVTF